MKRRFGDRKDGYRLRKADPLFRLIPYIMKDRTDAHVFFEDRIYLEKIYKLIKEMRAEDIKVGFLHIVIASMIRTISQKPKVNRFVSGKKTYARRELSVSLAVKKEMSETAEETTIKLFFEPTDTLYDVVNKVNDEVEKNKDVQSENSADKFNKFITFLPGFLISFTVFIVKFLENRGLLPKSLTKFSPFHSSVFISDLGSLGINPIYHHIYNFGTNSFFVTFGKRAKEQYIDDDNNVKIRKAMDIKIAVDERIVDGFYFANVIRTLMRTMSNPEQLLTPPKEVVIDDEI